MVVTSQEISGGNDLPKRRLGEILMQAGLITESDFSEALVESKKTGTFLGQILLQSGKITNDQLGHALSLQYNTKYVSLTKTEIDVSLLDLVPEELMRDKQLIPVSREGGRLVVAMVDPGDRSTTDEITFLTGMRPQVVVTTAMEFEETYRRYVADRSSNNLIEEIANSQKKGSIEDADDIRQKREAEITDLSNPLVKLVNAIIEEAIERNASDIHIEPRIRKYVVRFRIDGILRTILDIPQNMEASFVSRLKVMARMDIAEHRRPQDGRVALKYKGVEFNLRLNTLPVSDSREKIVIRILRPQRENTTFEELGFNKIETEKMEFLYTAPYGIILVCGPTGSGKTTTLYTVLSQINDEVRNISTVEDPVELSIEGLNQSQVNHKAEYTFASSMRALLRQDPDVIMVGEIRDYETLEAAIHASLTGHLVFSTIHSNTTAATITRLIEMGANPNLISTALIGIVAQRLCRTICPHCKVRYEASLEEKKKLFPHNPEKHAIDIILSKGEGCDFCGNTGYRGRSGIYEILVVDRDIRQLISTNASDLEIEDAAVASGMKTLSLGGREKILTGVTTLEEMIRVLGSSLGGH